MKLRLPWPSNLGGRTMIVLVAAVILVHLGSMLLYREPLLDAASDAQASQIAGRLQTARGAVAERPPAERDQEAHALSAPGLSLRWSDRPLLEAVEASSDRQLQLFRRRLADAVHEREQDIRVAYGERQPTGDSHVIFGSLPLGDGSYLNFSFPTVPSANASFHGTIVSTTAMAVGIALVGLLLVRTLVSPLRTLARAADAIGRGPEVSVPEDGPDEVRHVARAFNGMQARIHRLIADRTQALAAVSHDLRTPITRLRLRAGFLADTEAQTAMDADLDEMEAMIDATLAYLRGDLQPEESRVVDLAAMLTTLVDAAADSGQEAAFEGPQHAFLSLHELAMKRVFVNLLDNALTYGGSARLTLCITNDAARVTIDDNGPGIPPEDLERVFEPFQRLDASRNRRTGGVGLGLAIVRQAVAREGGTVRLINLPDRGLRAEVIIPIREGRSQACAPLGRRNTATASNFQSSHPLTVIAS